MESNNGAERAEVGADTVAVAECRWPAWVAVFTSGVMPATTARRTEHVGFVGSLLVHALGVVAYGLALCFAVSSSLSDLSLTDSVLTSIGRLIEEIAREPVTFALRFLLGVGIIESFALVVAMLISPWGARDEPWWASVWAAMRRLWLHTPQLVIVVLMFWMVDATLDAVDRGWEESRESNLAEPSAPMLPGPNASTEELEEFRVAQEEYTKQFEAYEHGWQYEWESRPWYLRYRYAIAELLVLLAGALWFATLLRSVGTERRVAAVQRSMTCEKCGYNLTGALPDALCSECGEPVAVSSSQRKSPWGARREAGWVRCWWQCTMEAVFRPRELGRKLPVSSWSSDHRRFLLVNLVIIWALSVLGMLASSCQLDGGELYVMGFGYVLFSVLNWAYWAVCLAVLCSLFAATIAGMLYRLSAKRNLLAATMQAASYMSGYLCLWVLFNCVAIPLVTVMGDWGWWRSIANMSRLDGDIIAFCVCFVPNVIMAVFYVGNVFRISSGARWANS